MICPYCKTKSDLPHQSQRWLESYAPDGNCLVATECCNKPVIVSSKLEFTVEKYNGSVEVDDWGREFTK